MRVFKSLPHKRTVLLSVAVIGFLLIATTWGTLPP